MLTTAVGRLRAVGMVEAVSFLLLLGVAMPLKYFAGMPLGGKDRRLDSWFAFHSFRRVFAGGSRRTPMADALDRIGFRRGAIAVRAICHRPAAQEWKVGRFEISARSKSG